MFITKQELIDCPYYVIFLNLYTLPFIVINKTLKSSMYNCSLNEYSKEMKHKSHSSLDVAYVLDTRTGETFHNTISLKPLDAVICMEIRKDLVGESKQTVFVKGDLYKDNFNCFSSPIFYYKHGLMYAEVEQVTIFIEKVLRYCEKDMKMKEIYYSAYTDKKRDIIFNPDIPVLE